MPEKSRWILFILPAAMMLPGMVACGNKGPLYIPDGPAVMESSKQDQTPSGDKGAESHSRGASEQ